MAIKYLRGQSGLPTVPVKTTRPTGFKFPVGLNFSSSSATANGASTATAETFDVLVVAGGGSGGGPSAPFGHSGGGGAGGVRLLSSNSFTEVTEYRNPSSISGTTNFIPVIVGGSGTNSCFGSSFITCRGGVGGTGGYGPTAAGPGGSGGGGAKQGPTPGAPVYFNNPLPGGDGIAGQGCCGTPGAPGVACGGAGGAATCSLTAPNICNCNGLTTSITGTSVRYGDGGNGSPTPCNGIAGTANRGNGGNGSAPGVNSGGAGGSGIVAIRYRNPAAPTTPLVTGGNTVCCTGGCIIHIFTSSGFLNVNSVFSIN
jgi:hypothetical protein